MEEAPPQVQDSARATNIALDLMKFVIRHDHWLRTHDLDRRGIYRHGIGGQAGRLR
jgi:hypothetical protein